MISADQVKKNQALSKSLYPTPTDLKPTLNKAYAVDELGFDIPLEKGDANATIDSEKIIRQAEKPAPTLRPKTSEVGVPTESVGTAPPQPKADEPMVQKPTEDFGQPLTSSPSAFSQPAQPAVTKELPQAVPEEKSDASDFWQTDSSQPAAPAPTTKIQLPPAPTSPSPTPEAQAIPPVPSPVTEAQVTPPAAGDQPIAPTDPRLLAKENLEIREARKVFQEGMLTVRDIIAPAAYIINPGYLQLGEVFCKTLFVYTYPRYLEANWLSPIINYDITMDIGILIHPLETANVMKELKTQVGKIQSSMMIAQEKGAPRDPELETALGDVEALRDVLQRGEVRLFQLGLYFTIYAHSLGELNTLTKQLESTLGGMLIYTKESLLQMSDGFIATAPLLLDNISVLRNLDTGSMSSIFPFTSSELTQEDGILYGINRHNNSLIIYDRFDLENANAVVFAKSGAGKSYLVKLEALRSLMFGTDIIIVDPENEYKNLCDAVGGSYLRYSLNSQQRINPFDLPRGLDPEKESGEDVLRSNISSVHGLINLMVGGLTPEEDALVEKGLYEAYALKDITTDPDSQKNEPPIMQDFYNVLSNMNGTESVTRRLSKYVEGTFAGLFNAPTNFELKPGFVVFSVRDLEEALRPVAMYTILNYIWTKIRMDMRRRLMIIDEAWWMMQYEDSAKFLHGLAKRARKYYLGLTIISQDVEDFLSSRFGKAIVSNSSMQILLKQSTASIDVVAETFGLTEGEKYLLLESDIGEGLFFAGLNHVAIKVIASYTEDQVITTNPEQLLAQAGETPSDQETL